MSTLRQFVVLLYDKTSSMCYVNAARVDLFARKGRDVYHIPPTFDVTSATQQRSQFCSNIARVFKINRSMFFLHNKKIFTSGVADKKKSSIDNVCVW